MRPLNFFSFSALGAMAAPPPSSPAYTPLYAVLPPTPNLPPARFSGTAQINNISLWYALYGAPLPSSNGPKPPTSKTNAPILLLHGVSPQLNASIPPTAHHPHLYPLLHQTTLTPTKGKISSRWFTHQITHLTQSHPHTTIITLDTRAHGRSADDLTVPLSYTLFASDAVALLTHLSIPRAAIIGWSDGANTALQMAMSYPSFVDRIFAFGANYRADQLNVTGLMGIPFLADLAGRMESEYKEVSATPGGYEVFEKRVDEMQAKLPDWGEREFGEIKTLFEEPRTAPVVWVVDGAEEEVVQRRVPGEIRDMIAGSGLVLLPDVGHFAPLQDPGTFNAMLDRWLARERG
ncbi:Alpha/Beta hydrolase protein [Podospora aff. communis PSN243]|uniref:Alpha/Beta hydrolase protein n=1 Tax=Podospora aff. communis PSN243 TaxID=3040156 RepID=A0AAV9H2M7_9PEZI|nr:Alpha/Beta hydrolase protein [Podospora aff. communis PSN243]